MRNNLIIILILMILLTGCKRADSSDIIFTDEASGSATEAPLEASVETSVEGPVEAPLEVSDTKKTLVIFVCGAVNEPGVYYLEEGLRIIDAIEAAGGFSDEADMTYVNLAAPLTDGIKLQIPTTAESMETDAKASIESYDESSVTASGSNAVGNGLININKASKEELKTLPGIGDGIASKIIDYRTENGNFSCIEDITKVSGIKDKLFAKIKEHITV